MWGYPDSLIKINLDRIKEKIQYCQNPKYCIINSETLEAIKEELPYKTIKEEGGYYDKEMKIYNLNIAICQKLKFGEFEIR